MASLFDLIESNDISGAALALKTGADVDALDTEGMSPLAKAVACGNLAFVRLLLQHGADVNFVIRSDPHTFESILCLATTKGHVDIVRELISSGADLHHRDDLGRTALCNAVFGEDAGRLVTAPVLIEAGADLELGESPPLFYAISGLPEAVELLLKAGANPNSYTGGITPLHLAIEEDDARAIPILIRYGADLTLRTEESHEFPGLTPLEYAREYKRKRLLPLLSDTAAAENTETNADLVGQIRDLKRLHPSLYKTFRSGVGSSTVKKFAASFGKALPDELSRLYSYTDGQNSNRRVPIYRNEAFLEQADYILSPLLEVIGDWQTMTELLDEGDFADENVIADHGVQPVWWHVGWIPLLANGNGNYLCYDTVPMPTGRVGQLVSVNHESAQRRILFSSLAALIQQATQEG